MEEKERLSNKSNLTWLIIIVAVFLVVGGGFSSNFDPSNIDISNLFGGGTTSTLVDVNKLLDFSLQDRYGGSALGTKTLLLYDGDSLQQLESLTTGADGTISTANTYESGDHLYVYYASSNDKQWFDITVPKMNPSDADSATVNVIKLESFAIGTYTSSTLYQVATAITDGGTYNKTASGNTPTFTFTVLNTGNDNTGLMSSYDPLYQHPFNVAMYVTFSTGNYETVLVYGFDYDYMLGTTHYVAKNLDPYSLTKHKIGNNYLSEGSQAVTFSLDLTGYSGDTTVMQIYAYAYTDPSYSMSHGGAFGVNAVQLDEITVTLQD